MQEGKLWVKVHSGKSGLKPLLGAYKYKKGQGDFVRLPDDVCAIGSPNFFSASLPALDGPADIEFLRNKFGWCMPTVDQVVGSQKLNAGLRNNTVPQKTPFTHSRVTSSKSLQSSEDQRIQMYLHKHHFSSKTSDQIDREKLMSKITEELRDYERFQAYAALHQQPRSRRSSGQLSDESKPKRTFRHRASSFVRHKEIRTTEVFKISNRATSSFKSHFVIMEKKLSLQSKDDSELTKSVRSKLQKSKSLDRMEKLTKISRLETQRKKFSNVHPETVAESPKLEPANENVEEEEEDDNDTDFLQI